MRRSLAQTETSSANTYLVKSVV